MRRRSFATMGTLFLLLGACNGGHEPQSAPGTSTGTSAAPLSTNGVEATLNLQSDWNTGYCAEVALKNTSAAPVTSWTAVVDLHQSTLSQIWNGIATQSGSQITVKPAGAWNSTLAPGASQVVFGFCGSTTGLNYRPTLASLDVTGGSSGGGVTSYTLTVAASGNGTTSPAAGAHTYASGTSVEVSATPASGATFTGWSGAASGTARDGRDGREQGPHRQLLGRRRRRRWWRWRRRRGRQAHWRQLVRLRDGQLRAARSVDA